MGADIPSGDCSSSSENYFFYHTLRLLDSGEAAHLGNKAAFSFETSWFEREGFHDLVAQEWSQETRGATNIERWQFKIHHPRQFLRGWAKNLSSIYKKEKERLLNIVNTRY